MSVGPLCKGRYSQKNILFRAQQTSPTPAPRLGDAEMTHRRDNALHGVTSSSQVQTQWPLVESTRSR